MDDIFDDFEFDTPPLAPRNIDDLDFNDSPIATSKRESISIERLPQFLETMATELQSQIYNNNPKTVFTILNSLVNSSRDNFCKYFTNLYTDNKGQSLAINWTDEEMALGFSDSFGNPYLIFIYLIKIYENKYFVHLLQKSSTIQIDAQSLKNYPSFTKFINSDIFHETTPDNQTLSIEEEEESDPDFQFKILSSSRTSKTNRKHKLKKSHLFKFTPKDVNMVLKVFRKLSEFWTIISPIFDKLPLFLLEKLYISLTNMALFSGAFNIAISSLISSPLNFQFYSLPPVFPRCIDLFHIYNSRNALSNSFSPAYFLPSFARTNAITVENIFQLFSLWDSTITLNIKSVPMTKLLESTNLILLFNSKSHPYLPSFLVSKYGILTILEKSLQSLYTETFSYIRGQFMPQVLIFIRIFLDSVLKKRKKSSSISTLGLHTKFHQEYLTGTSLPSAIAIIQSIFSLLLKRLNFHTPPSLSILDPNFPIGFIFHSLPFLEEILCDSDNSSNGTPLEESSLNANLEKILSSNGLPHVGPIFLSTQQLFSIICSSHTLTYHTMISLFPIFLDSISHAISIFSTQQLGTFDFNSSRESLFWLFVTLRETLIAFCSLDNNKAVSTLFVSIWSRISQLLVESEIQDPLVTPGSTLVWTWDTIQIAFQCLNIILTLGFVRYVRNPPLTKKPHNEPILLLDSQQLKTVIHHFHQIALKFFTNIFKTLPTLTFIAFLFSWIRFSALWHFPPFQQITDILKEPPESLTPETIDIKDTRNLQRLLVQHSPLRLKVFTWLFTASTEYSTFQKIDQNPTGDPTTLKTKNIISLKFAASNRRKHKHRDSSEKEKGSTLVRMLNIPLYLISTTLLALVYPSFSLQHILSLDFSTRLSSLHFISFAYFPRLSDIISFPESQFTEIMFKMFNLMVSLYNSPPLTKPKQKSSKSHRRNVYAPLDKDLLSFLQSHQFIFPVFDSSSDTIDTIYEYFGIRGTISMKLGEGVFHSLPGYLCSTSPQLWHLNQKILSIWFDMVSPSVSPTVLPASVSPDASVLLPPPNLMTSSKKSLKENPLFHDYSLFSLYYNNVNVKPRKTTDQWRLLPPIPLDTLFFLHLVHNFKNVQNSFWNASFLGYCQILLSLFPRVQIFQEKHHSSTFLNSTFEHLLMNLELRSFSPPDTNDATPVELETTERENQTTPPPNRGTLRSTRSFDNEELHSQITFLNTSVIQLGIVSLAMNKMKNFKIHSTLSSLVSSATTCTMQPLFPDSPYLFNKFSFALTFSYLFSCISYPQLRNQSTSWRNCWNPISWDILLTPNPHLQEAQLELLTTIIQYCHSCIENAEMDVKTPISPKTVNTSESTISAPHPLPKYISSPIGPWKSSFLRKSLDNFVLPRYSSHQLTKIFFLSKVPFIIPSIKTLLSELECTSATLISTTKELACSLPFSQYRLPILDFLIGVLRLVEKHIDNLEAIDIDNGDSLSLNSPDSLDLDSPISNYVVNHKQLELIEKQFFIYLCNHINVCDACTIEKIFTFFKTDYNLPIEDSQMILQVFKLAFRYSFDLVNIVDESFDSGGIFPCLKTVMKIYSSPRDNSLLHIHFLDVWSPLLFKYLFLFSFRDNDDDDDDASNTHIIENHLFSLISTFHPGILARFIQRFLLGNQNEKKFEKLSHLTKFLESQHYPFHTLINELKELGIFSFEMMKFLVSCTGNPNLILSGPPGNCIGPKTAYFSTLGNITSSSHILNIPPVYPINLQSILEFLWLFETVENINHQCDTHLLWSIEPILSCHPVFQLIGLFSDYPINSRILSSGTSANIVNIPTESSNDVIIIDEEEEEELASPSSQKVSKKKPHSQISFKLVSDQLLYIVDKFENLTNVNIPSGLNIASFFQKWCSETFTENDALCFSQLDTIHTLDYAHHDTWTMMLLGSIGISVRESRSKNSDSFKLKPKFPSFSSNTEQQNLSACQFLVDSLDKIFISLISTLFHPELSTRERETNSSYKLFFSIVSFAFSCHYCISNFKKDTNLRKELEAPLFVSRNVSRNDSAYSWDFIVSKMPNKSLQETKQLFDSVISALHTPTSTSVVDQSRINLVNQLLQVVQGNPQTCDIASKFQILFHLIPLLDNDFCDWIIPFLVWLTALSPLEQIAPSASEPQNRGNPFLADLSISTRDSLESVSSSRVLKTPQLTRPLNLPNTTSRISPITVSSCDPNSNFKFSPGLSIWIKEWIPDKFPHFLFLTMKRHLSDAKLIQTKLDLKHERDVYKNYHFLAISEYQKYLESHLESFLPKSTKTLQQYQLDFITKNTGGNGPQFSVWSPLPSTEYDSFHSAATHSLPLWPWKDWLKSSAKNSEIPNPQGDSTGTIFPSNETDIFSNTNSPFNFSFKSKTSNIHHSRGDASSETIWNSTTWEQQFTALISFVKLCSPSWKGPKRLNNSLLDWFSSIEYTNANRNPNRNHHHFLASYAFQHHNYSELRKCIQKQGGNSLLKINLDVAKLWTCQFWWSQKEIRAINLLPTNSFNPQIASLATSLQCLWGTQAGIKLYSSCLADLDSILNNFNVSSLGNTFGLFSTAHFAQVLFSGLNSVNSSLRKLTSESTAEMNRSRKLDLKSAVSNFNALNKELHKLKSELEQRISRKTPTPTHHPKMDRFNFLSGYVPVLYKQIRHLQSELAKSEADKKSLFQFKNAFIVSSFSLSVYFCLLISSPGALVGMDSGSKNYDDFMLRDVQNTFSNLELEDLSVTIPLQLYRIWSSYSISYPMFNSILVNLSNRNPLLFASLLPQFSAHFVKPLESESNDKLKAPTDHDPNSIPAYRFLSKFLLQQNQKNPHGKKNHDNFSLLFTIFDNVFNHFPQQVVWILTGLSRPGYVDENDNIIGDTISDISKVNHKRKLIYPQYVSNLLIHFQQHPVNKNSMSWVDGIRSLASAYNELADYNPLKHGDSSKIQSVYQKEFPLYTTTTSKRTRPTRTNTQRGYKEFPAFDLHNYTPLGLLERKVSGKFLLPTCSQFFAFPLTGKVLYSENSQSLVDDTQAVPQIESILPFWKYVGKGKSNPKLVSVKLTDGTIVKQLIKAGEDVRQDAIFLQLSGLISTLCSRHLESFTPEIPRYQIIPLSSDAGIIEFLTAFSSLGSYLSGKDKNSPGAHDRYRISDKMLSCAEAKRRIADAGVLKRSSKANKKKSYQRDHQQVITTYKYVCEHFPPVFRYFFMDNFQNPMQWVSSRINYALSLAGTSMIGTVCGLGDRHVENILISKSTGVLCHIDFGILFNQGSNLRIPELVPFRFTPDMRDGLGSLDSIFRETCTRVLTLLRKYQSSIESILMVFINDPIRSWNSPARDAQNALEFVKATLQGRVQDNVLSPYGHVINLIDTASKIENLALIYYGWGPQY